MNEICCMQAKDVDTQDLSCVFSVDHFGHSITLLLCECLDAGIVSARSASSGCSRIKMKQSGTILES